MLTVEDIDRMHIDGTLCGCYTNEELHNSVYHKCSGISKSGLDAIRRSPGYYKWVYIDRRPKETTSEMMFGSLFHTLILEPDKFDEQWEELKPKTKNTQIKWQDDLRYMQDSVCREEILMTALGSGEKERSYFWEERGILCKSRCDLVLGHILIDLKTIINAQEADKSIGKWRYDVQDAFYSSGHWHVFGEVPRFAFAFVEKKPPYEVRLIQLDQDAQTFGADRYKEDIDTYKKCLDSGIWKSYNGIEIAGLPAWRYYQEDKNR